MIYRDFQGEKLSALGFGTMRLPVLDEDYGKVDEKKAAEMFDYAISHGVNYFDTAWGYHDGESENVVGRILSSYPRESLKIATKFPGYDLSNMGKVEEIFEKQLKKCGTDYFDFYLFHNVCEMNIDAYLDDEKYARKLCAYLLESKNLSKRHLAAEMAKRGLSRDLISQVLEEVEVDPVSQIVQLLQTKFAAKLQAENGVQKVTAALLRKGFTYAEIKSAFYRLETDDYAL